MSALEVAGWRAHFTRYPSAEFILALLWLTVARALGSNTASSADMGWWLEPPLARQTRETREKNEQRIVMATIVSAAYQRRRNES